ncbi:Ankyrin repeat [Dillenia turbinata]|uniref:Ankyrin repeat n=1 Tax=Dillenia turbinata TaxID=194707 RepID=A0AAN8URY8_9MAGN
MNCSISNRIIRILKELKLLQEKWIDKERKTPLILACMNPKRLNVAKTLIDLGANPNAYHPGHHAGTPLHHAAKRGLDRTVKLLLSHIANPLVINDNCQAIPDVARAKGFNNVLRAIEWLDARALWARLFGSNYYFGRHINHKV